MAHRFRYYNVQSICVCQRSSLSRYVQHRYTYLVLQGDHFDAQASHVNCIAMIGGEEAAEFPDEELRGGAQPSIAQSIQMRSPDCATRKDEEMQCSASRRIEKMPEFTTQDLHHSSGTERLPSAPGDVSVTCSK